LTQSLRALLAGQGVTVHAVVLGPVDTDMNRGFNIPKVSTESAAVGIFDGLEKAKRRSSPIPRPGPSRRAGALGYPRRLSAIRRFRAAAVCQRLRNVLISDRKTKEK